MTGGAIRTKLGRTEGGAGIAAAFRVAVATIASGE
jgi:hypothetical protein